MNLFVIGTYLLDSAVEARQIQLMVVGVGLGTKDGTQSIQCLDLSFVIALLDGIAIVV